MSKVTWLGQVVPVPAPERYELMMHGIPPSSVVLRTSERTVALGGPRVLQLGQPGEPVKTDWGMFWGLLSVAGAALSAYHGYKRNHESTGSAVGWGVLGGLFPVITVPVALAQGYGKPAGARENPHEFAEVGVFEHEGVKYEARGAFYDREHGTLAGYPVAPHKSSLPGQGARYELVQFDGTLIVPLRLVKKYQGRTMYGRSTMYAWSATYDGRVFSGRNSGPNMFLRMRAGRSLK